jgi:hypothetical protein
MPYCNKKNLIYFADRKKEIKSENSAATLESLHIPHRFFSFFVKIKRFSPKNFTALLSSLGGTGRIRQ